jgi:voltage-gated potassium channel Kch
MIVVSCVLAFTLIALTLQDAFEVVLLPRRVSRRFRFTSGFFRAGWRLWRALAKAAPFGAAREGFLSIFGPLAMLLLFVAWAGALILGFGVLQWSSAHGAGRAVSLPRELYLSGVTFFTLGYGDVTPLTRLGKLTSVIEAGVGFGLIAVVIGYLPVLYQLFSRREAHVLQLDARAGSPPTASVLLRRHVEGGVLRGLDQVLRAWEVWGAELLESHLSYPMLAYYRSQHDDQSWLAALAAVLDASTLVLVGVEGAAPLQARMTFAILRQVVIEMARSLKIAAARSAAPLDPDAYGAMLAMFAAAEVPWKTGTEVEETLAAIRATYAPLLLGLADYLLIPLPALTPLEDTADHWDQGPRGLIARRLLEGLADGSMADGPVRARGHTPAARLRERLRRG